MTKLSDRNVYSVITGLAVALVGLGVYWLFSVPQEVPSGLIILQANYGENCARSATASSGRNTYRPGNATEYVSNFCRGSKTCTFRVDVNLLSDPAKGCAKDFTVRYLCRQNGNLRTFHLASEANGKYATLQCQQ